MGVIPSVRLVATFAFPALLAACGLANRGENRTGADAPTVEVVGDSLAWAGRPLVLGAPLAEWESVLGPADRRVDRAGGLLTWDRLGAVATLAFTAPLSTPRVSSFWICLVPGRADFWPNRTFPGILTYDQEAGEAGPAPLRLEPRLTEEDLLRHGFAWVEGFPHLSSTASVRLADGGKGLEVFILQLHPAARPAP